MPDSTEFDFTPPQPTSPPAGEDFARPADPSPEEAFPSPPTPTPAARPTPSPDDSAINVVWETLQTLVLAGLLIVFFRAFIFQNFAVEGSSMFPTLAQSDRLIVSRISYLFGEPRRGDIIVFQYPNGPERDFVKRIIGEPGETVAVQRGQVFINGKPLPPEEYVQNKSSDTMAPTTLADDEYFVMGDNRTGSSDSRSWGPLQKHFIIGKAWLIYYPFKHFKFLQHAQIDPLP